VRRYPSARSHRLQATASVGVRAATARKLIDLDGDGISSRSDHAFHKRRNACIRLRIVRRWLPPPALRDVHDAGTAISTGFAAGFWRFLRGPRLVTIVMAQSTASSSSSVTGHAAGTGSGGSPSIVAGIRRIDMLPRFTSHICHQRPVRAYLNETHNRTDSLARRHACPKGLRQASGCRPCRRASRLTWCSDGWGMPSSPPRPSMRMPWARRSRTSQAGCGEFWSRFVIISPRAAQKKRAPQCPLNPLHREGIKKRCD